MRATSIFRGWILIYSVARAVLENEMFVISRGSKVYWNKDKNL